nr:MAG TPA: Minor capsid protein from bacteriophage [Caudoviricetes sp.]DAE51014.1 MAG TPA: Minor capsid protein from bacteriophage [Caudoviricetes sp.]
MEYSINALPCNPLIKKYADGGSVKQFQFALTSKDCYDGDARTAIENSGFYERFEDWIEQQDIKGILPELSGDKAPVSITVMQKGYLYDLDTDLGQYEIQCKLEYEQEV